MHVGDVAGLADRRVVTVTPDDTIADAVDLLAEYGIGAVVATTDGKSILGIMSERDIVRHLQHEQEGTLRLKIEDLMTRNVSTCRSTDDLEATMAVMTEGKFRHMPVVDDEGALCGIISLADLVAARLAELERQLG